MDILGARRRRSGLRQTHFVAPPVLQPRHKPDKHHPSRIGRLLPDIAYAGVVFTMPRQLWPIFKRNRHLLHDLPALGAAVIQHWASETYGLRTLIVVVPHTFGAHLNFNCHLHILVSAGGLDESEGRWVNSVEFDHVALMARWRYAVITFLREALKANVLIYHLSAEKLKHVFTTHYERNWIIKVAEFVSKQHFLQYAARYVRRPPIAQRRILKITDEQVEFWTKDKKERRVVTTRFPLRSSLRFWRSRCRTATATRSAILGCGRPPRKEKPPAPYSCSFTRKDNFAHTG